MSQFPRAQPTGPKPGTGWAEQDVSGTVPTSDATPLVGWYVRGFAGLASLIIRHLKEPSHWPESWLGELHKAVKALDEVLTAIRGGK